jgi:hypothetical protein
VNAGRLIVAALVLAGILAGAGMYYLQVYAYYDRLEPRITLLVEAEDGTRRLTIAAYQGIDSDSSPLRLRECFTVMGDVEGLTPYPRPQPLNAPGWFRCFDARGLSDDLAAGRADAWLIEGNVRFGFDRVMALYPDGRGFVWVQTNACGTAHFDGRPLPAGCPPAP